jgi:serine protease inhibitor
MVALLPPAAASACAMPTATALGTVTGALAAGSAGNVARDVYLPRADLSSDVSMKSLLTGLGMGVAFTSSADFTGLSPQACCIGLVQQADTLRVGEQGTTASAATAVGVMPGAAMVGPPPVNFDRPYLMLVTDAATGEPLFMARVANPAAR